MQKKADIAGRKSLAGYNHSFLKQVILRLDFAAGLEKLNAGLPAKLKRAVLKHYPIQGEARRSISLDIELKKPSRGREKRTVIDSGSLSWVFHDEAKSQTLDLSQGALVLDVSRYSGYKGVRSGFLGAVNAIFESFPSVSPTRLGMRYINRVVLEEADPFAWNHYLSPSLLRTISPRPAEGELIREIHSVEMRFKELTLRFQSGFLNPDYPAAIRRKDFLLDLDAHQVGYIERKEIGALLTAFHKRIQTTFEANITDALREKMNG